MIQFAITKEWSQLLYIKGKKRILNVCGWCTVATEALWHSIKSNGLQSQVIAVFLALSGGFRSNEEKGKLQGFMDLGSKIRTLMLKGERKETSKYPTVHI